MATRWCTMEDVQADLARAGAVGGAGRGGGAWLLQGQRPPPRHAAPEECEEEQQLRYGAAVEVTAPLHGGTGVTAPLQPSPDLRGITSMLRMVQNYGSPDSTQNLTTSDEVIVISKLTPQTPKREPVLPSEPADSAFRSALNPNATDFVPKTYSPNPTERNIGSTEGIGLGGKSDKLEMNNNTVIITDGSRQRGSPESMTEQQRTERSELDAMLRSKIRASPAEGCPRLRRERYAAIAGLLRLHSSPDPAPTLRTPDYFRTHRAEPEARASRPLPPENSTDEPERAASPDERVVRDSISKVSEWLHAAPPPPAPAPAPAPVRPHLGPLSYRRREGGTAAGRSLPAPPADVSYVPSAHALALQQQYAARVRSAPAPPPDLWERLEMELRAREARRAPAPAPASAPEDGS